ncbi:CDPK-related protein kinase [Morus notabilis]|uniref:non-specific serine/threonine protein kinase n=2 Tax=Morus notabilis TaxID=981085 RepID=W9S6C7_9ROSA|nr:CDPK-related kinase 5 isoform X1 [Morus notabilis]EXC17375.1 CDPK-related protein kinase [Morus notabilis]
MGTCTSKPSRPNPYASRDPNDPSHTPKSLPATTPHHHDNDVVSNNTAKQSPFFPFYSPSPAHYLKGSPARSRSRSASSTPRRFFRRPFPPPSPAKHIRAVLARRHGKKAAAAESAIPEEGDEEENGVDLDKRFGFSKEFTSRLEVGDEVGRGHFGYTCSARFKKGDRKGQHVAVKVIPKSKMTTAIAIEDVRREVKILRALTGHSNLVQFYEAFEDSDNVYIVMELCEGGELLDRILSRGGKYTEDDAKAVMAQILKVVAFCHLQGVVHRDLKPENFLYTTKDENSMLKAIDFGLSDFVKPDEKLNDIVGSAYYVAPEVLHRAYSTEADVWSVGVIAYILLCGSRPFWARTESGIFRAVLKAGPSFDEQPWPSLSLEAKDFVKRLLNKDPRKRMTAAQALSHPWIRNYNDVKVPLDILILRLMKAYLRSSSLRKAALKALSRTLTVDELFYLKEQFALLEPNKNGTISLDNIKMTLMKSATDAMKESRIPDFIASLSALQYRRMDFEEFCAAALGVHQLEALDRWEQHARCAYELFEKDGNRAIVIEELASELGLGPSIPLHVVLHDWIRHTDGKLSFLGFVKLLHGVSSRTFVKAQ